MIKIFSKHRKCLIIVFSIYVCLWIIGFVLFNYRHPDFEISAALFYGPFYSTPYNVLFNPPLRAFDDLWPFLFPGLSGH